MFVSTLISGITYKGFVRNSCKSNRWTELSTYRSFAWRSARKNGFPGKTITTTTQKYIGTLTGKNTSPGKLFQKKLLFEVSSVFETRQKGSNFMALRCRGCPTEPPLCQGKRFENLHANAE
jgi:hypothetical protein